MLDALQPSLLVLMETELWPNLIRAGARPRHPGRGGQRPHLDALVPALPPHRAAAEARAGAGRPLPHAGRRARRAHPRAGRAARARTRHRQPQVRRAAPSPAAAGAGARGAGRPGAALGRRQHHGRRGGAGAARVRGCARRAPRAAPGAGAAPPGAVRGGAGAVRGRGAPLRAPQRAGRRALARRRRAAARHRRRAGARRTRSRPWCSWAAAWCPPAGTTCSSRRSPARRCVVGPHMENFQEIADAFRVAGALVQVASADELGRAIAALLADDARRRRSASGRAPLVVRNRGGLDTHRARAGRAARVNVRPAPGWARSVPRTGPSAPRVRPLRARDPADPPPARPRDQRRQPRGRRPRQDAGGRAASPSGQRDDGLPVAILSRGYGGSFAATRSSCRTAGRRTRTPRSPATSR